MKRLVPKPFRRLPGIACVCRKAEERHRYWLAMRRLGRKPSPYTGRMGWRLFWATMVGVVITSAASRVVAPVTVGPVAKVFLIGVVPLLTGGYLGLLYVAIMEYDFAPYGIHDGASRDGEG